MPNGSEVACRRVDRQHTRPRRGGHGPGEKTVGDGQPRRTSGDLFFGEVRAFDEIFRESQDMSSDEDEPSPSNQPRGQARRLAELQKQIISATWKLQRDGATPQYAQDAKVV